MLKQNFIVLFITCLSLLQISAQDQARQDDLYSLPPAQEGDLLCRCVSTFQLQKSETFYFKLDGTYHEVALTSEGISMTFPVRKTNIFTLYSKGLSEEGKVVYIPVVEQMLDGPGVDHLVILSRTPNSKTMVSTAHNLHTDIYPANALHLFNQTPLSLGVQVDNVNALVKPLELYTHKFKNVDRNAYTSAKIAIAYKGEAKIMSSKRLRLLPGRRVIMICFPSKARSDMGATPLRVLTLQDMP
ncbi:MAG: hypothetical protein NWT02_12210 [Opitutales bacterium]|jgi:hypothetical protein|nr:hypothetical protein [Opitutales bacterium]MDP4644311.1 hypothetical protein [Opitutales bacterium]